MSETSSLRSKLETLAWFAKRPAMYREAARRILTMRLTTTASVETARKEKIRGQEWCAARVSAPEALFAQLGLPVSMSPLVEVESAAWTRAIDEARRVPGMGGPGHVDLLYHLCRHLPGRAVIETGVAAGWSSLAILLAMDRNGTGRLVSIDMPYPKRENAHLVGALVLPSLRDRWTLLRRPDRDALPGAIASLGTLDLAHYDSDKSREGRSFAYPRLWGALRVGGVLVSDDVEDNSAFAEFADDVGKRPFIFRKSEGNFAGALVK